MFFAWASGNKNHTKRRARSHQGKSGKYIYIYIYIYMQTKYWCFCCLEKLRGEYFVGLPLTRCCTLPEGVLCGPRHGATSSKCLYEDNEGLHFVTPPRPRGNPEAELVSSLIKFGKIFTGQQLISTLSPLSYTYHIGGISRVCHETTLRKKSKFRVCVSMSDYEQHGRRHKQ